MTTKADFTATETRMKVSGYIGMAYVIGGVTRANDTDFDILLDLTIEELGHNYGYLEIGEVKTAIIEGSKGRYGDYFGINLKTIIGWLDGYLDSDARRVLIAARNMAMRETEMKALPVRDEDRELRESINEAYSRYCREERPKAPEPGTIGDCLRKSYGDYDLSSPLLDIGKPKERYCNRHGLQGTLQEIFDRARNLGRKVIFKI